jgi:5'-nucleotidase
MSKNSADTSLRIFNSIEHYGLNISRAALVGGLKISPYLSAFKTDLFLSANEDDVQEAINANIAAGIICSHGEFPIEPNQEIDQIRIAFDGDAVIFSDESEQIYQADGLKAFAEHEHTNAQKPLPEGPFAKLLKTISIIQQQFPKESVPIRTALVTARNAPAHERVIRTLRAWNVRIDEAFFLGGIEKSEVLKAFGANIFFDDQSVHTDPASKVVPAARVLYKK